MSHYPQPLSSNTYQYDPFSPENYSEPTYSHPPYQYPPYHLTEDEVAAASTYSLPLDDRDEVPLGYGTSGAVLREKGNPYAIKSGTGRRKWIWIGVGLLVLVGVGVGIGVWRAKASKSNDSTSSSSNSTSSSGKLEAISGTAGVVKSDPNNPSDFEKDSRLHQSFYGIAYTPFLAQEPWCGATLANVTEDIQLLSQITTRIRMYGSGCNQSALVLQAIEDTKVNMTVWLGVYIGDNSTVNTQQMDETLAVLTTYGADHVSGVTVGNEYILDADDQSTAVTYIVEQMASFRTQLLALNLSKTLPVGTADAGSVITTALATGADYIMANVHPFFGGLPIDQAAAWTDSYFQETDVSVTTAAPNNPPAYIAETGWPTASMTAANATDGAAVAGVTELQTFLDDFVCAANTNGTMYFFFEMFDEPWKEQYGGVEPYWGLCDSNKILKNVTIPQC